ncbi:alpha-amylase-like isoform X2 [Dreissena polymorpha]|uniref:alpha-amylase-like isoform X2 n=1 Tax=Dreissena polymorpha TaxID=45954 RepID=UPI002263B146|nr:alpha-amylase-like isoform X2 [Dreissena polymorpha]
MSDKNSNNIGYSYKCDVLSQYTDPHCDGKQVIVELFEWKWTAIANECDFLSKKGFCGVQVSPANEHVMVTSPPRPWWERYQPVSYKLNSRSGTEAEFADMVSRCKARRVRIYVDVVLNNMAALGQNGNGTAGSDFESGTRWFPAVPYTDKDFNKPCSVNASSEVRIIRDCYLNGLTDLNQTSYNVQNRTVAFLNSLIDHGVAGFRIAAATYMWPNDLQAIQRQVKDLPEGGRPFFYFEVNDTDNETVTTQEYTSLGYVTEFRYCTDIKQGIESFERLGKTTNYVRNITDPDHAFVYVDDHNSQRNHGSGGTVLTFENQINYKLAVAFTLANDYGFPRVMSSYYFGDNNDLGPPHYANFTTKGVPFKADESCGFDWVCEHRWKSIANMVAFRNTVVGTNKENNFHTSDQVAFSRGHKGFFAMAKNGTMNATLQTGLPAGHYRDLINGRVVTVDDNGMAQIVIDNPEEPVLAISVDSRINYSSSHYPSGTSAGPSSTSTILASTAAITLITTGGLHSSTARPSSTTYGLASTTAGLTMSRTVILIEKLTNNGQDLFIRGGLDVASHRGCGTNITACEIPISHRPIGNSSHYEKYNAWSVGDRFLDWNTTAESGQKADAQGTPAVWTTNDIQHLGHSSLNQYAPHYWLVDIDMDCSRTQNGWFEFKAFINGQWEHNIKSDACIGSGAGTPPGSTPNHWAKCGMFNIYHYEKNSCEIKNIP